MSDSCTIIECHGVNNIGLKLNSIPLDRFFVGDCVDAMQTHLPDSSVDLTVTSPPYDGLRDYDGYAFNFYAIVEELFRVTKDGGVVVWVVGDRINGGRTMTSFEQGIGFRDAGFAVHDVMIYQKLNTPFPRSNAYTNAWEFMFVCSKGQPKTFNPLKTATKRNGPEWLTFNKGPDAVNKKRRGVLRKTKTRTNIWPYAVGRGGTTNDKEAFEHPAMFPESLALDHILSWSNEGDLVLDPMCGAGTTAKMAALNGRHYLGIDISEKYIGIATRRVLTATGAASVDESVSPESAIHLVDGQLSICEESDEHPAFVTA